MTSLTLVLLVDAFRQNYVQRTSFIRALAAGGRTGALREDFGFTPRAGYFGGLGPSAAGFTNMYWCDPSNSPFGHARGVPSSRFGREVEEQLGIRSWLDAEAKKRTTRFAANYISTAEIPIPLLPWFDVTEKYGPADRRVGYTTTLHELDDRSWPYFCCLWPESNAMADHTDQAIARATLDAVHPPHRYAFVHLQELDGAGHMYGPESGQILDAIARTDALVATIVTELRSRFDRVNVILFGDHGMVSVASTMNVWAAIESSGLRIGDDIVPFLDSTMARFWFPSRAARQRAIDALAPLPGRILDDDDLDRHDMRGCDRRNGELIFLADPGVLIVPNFFHRRGALPLAMHGYEPDCPDNQGVFLVHEPSTPPQTIGAQRPSAVYSESRRLLGLGGSSSITVTLPGTKRLTGTLTQHPDPRAHAMVQTHMARVVDAITTTVPETRAVVLAGSFGRDEGGITADGEGVFRPLNDYDVLVVAPGDVDRSADVTVLGERLAKEFGIDFVHFAVVPAIDPAAPPTLSNFDLRYGSHVLWGDDAVMQRLPRYASADIPVIEAVQLLCNRLGGLLSSVRPPANRDLDRREDRYFINQVMKGVMALGDWRLLRARAYDTSYQTRLERFSWLASGLAVAADERDAIEHAYQFKLHPDRVKSRTISAMADSVQRWLVAAVRCAIGEASQRVVRTASEAASAYCATVTADAGTIAQDNARTRQLFAGGGIVRALPESDHWIRREIYAALPLVAAASDGDRDAFADAGRRLGACLEPAWPDELTSDNWEFVRQHLTHAWLTLVL